MLGIKTIYAVIKHIVSFMFHINCLKPLIDLRGILIFLCYFIRCSILYLRSLLEVDSMKKISILIHGYNKNQRDMGVLKENLEKLGHEAIVVNLPLTFHDITYAISVFENRIEEILVDLQHNEKINLIGHSTGGLIIRNFLANAKRLDRINRCVLIATPNNGSELADMAVKHVRGFTRIFKTVQALQSENVRKLRLIEKYDIPIGAIAGNRSHLVLGRLLSDENDGRIKISSVQYEKLNDFIILPYGHKEIHYKWKTAQMVDAFIKYGRFQNRLL